MTLAGGVQVYVAPFLGAGALLGFGIVVGALSRTAEVRLREEWEDGLDYARIAALVTAALVGLYLAIQVPVPVDCPSSYPWRGPVEPCGPYGMPLGYFLAFVAVGGLMGFYVVSAFWTRADSASSE